MIRTIKIWKLIILKRSNVWKKNTSIKEVFLGNIITFVVAETSEEVVVISEGDFFRG